MYLQFNDPVKAESFKSVPSFASFSAKANGEIISRQVASDDVRVAQQLIFNMEHSEIDAHRGI